MDPLTVAAIAAPVVGGLFSAKGAKDANKANIAASQRQMDFQERMSSTAYQRAMDDMRKAGLNPILAGKLGGASTPQGSVPNISNVYGDFAQVGANVSQGIATAQQGQKIQHEIQQIDATTAHIAEQNNLTQEQQQVAKQAVQKSVQEIKNLEQQNITQQKINEIGEEVLQIIRTASPGDAVSEGVSTIRSVIQTVGQTLGELVGSLSMSIPDQVVNRLIDAIMGEHPNHIPRYRGNQ